MLKRMGLSSAGAAAITLGLGLGMMAMIAVDFSPNEKYPAALYDVNAVEDDIAPPKPRQRLEDYKRVETPPPPVLDREVTSLPGEPIPAIPEPPGFPPVIIDTDGPIISVIDKDEQPILRYPPAMPPRADRSGHCMMHFDVSASGEPYNISAASCSQSLFKRASIKAVSRWKYRPRVQNGQAVSRTGLETRISFNLSDGRGQLIPE